MKFLINSLLLIVIISVLGCKTEEPCKNYETYTGAIIGNVDLGKCFVLMTDTAYVVRTRTQLHALQQQIDPEYKKTYGAYCDTLSMDKLVEIDFANESVLGLYAEGTGCSVAFSKKVTIDDRNEKVLYEITVYECGNCEMIRSDMNWVKTRKIPDYYTVEYKITKESNL